MEYGMGRGTKSLHQARGCLAVLMPGDAQVTFSILFPTVLQHKTKKNDILALGRVDKDGRNINTIVSACSEKSSQVKLFAPTPHHHSSMNHTLTLQDLLLFSEQNYQFELSLHESFAFCLRTEFLIIWVCVRQISIDSQLS